MFASTLMVAQIFPFQVVNAAPSDDAYVNSIAQPGDCDQFVQEEIEYTFLDSPDNTQEMLDRQGMVGRLYIPDVGIDVALFQTSVSDISQQKAYADAPDSGIWMQKGNTIIFGDHASEGFDGIADVVPGVTMCYLQIGSEVNPFLCLQKGTGHNLRSDLVDEEGNTLIDTEEYSMLCYACADSTGRNIYYAYWEPVSIRNGVTDSIGQ